MSLIVMKAGCMAPAMVHYGQAEHVVAARQETLLAAYLAHPERFVRRPPQPPALPRQAWINPPVERAKDLDPPAIVTPDMLTGGCSLNANGNCLKIVDTLRDSEVETAALAGSKKNAAKQGRTIVFIDESGLSQRPHRCRTWAPRGQTPVLQFHFNWKKLSAVAGITWWNFYFRLFPGAIRAPQVIEFLRHLQQHLPGKLLVVWDGLQSHRSRLVRQYVERQQGRLVLEFLPAYAPELSPVEYLWGHWKQHELPNFCPKDYAQLSGHARRALRRMQRRPTLVAAFWKQSKLF